MSRIAGIQIEKDSKGSFSKLHIDLKKFGNDDDIAHFLTKNGINTKKESDYVSLEEVKKQTSKFIEKLNWKK